MAIQFERSHDTQFLIRGRTPINPDSVIVTVSGTTPWHPGQVLGRVTATGKYVKYMPGATDGSQIAVGVLFYWLPPVAGDVRTSVLLRDAEVSASRLIGLDLAAAASLTSRGVVVREGTVFETTYTNPDYVAIGYVS